MASIHVDFEVFSSPYYLKVRDLSVWELIKDKPSIIEIWIPGYPEPIKKYFDKNKLNVFNSNMLELNCEGQAGLNTLPDGIYKIKVTGSPEKFTKEDYYLKTDLFDMEVDKIVIDNVEKIGEQAYEDKLTRIEMLKMTAQAYLRYGIVDKAGVFFEQAQDMVEDLVECADCRDKK